MQVSEYPTIQVFKRNAEEGKPWKGARFYDALLHIVDTQFEAETTEEEQTAEPDATPKSEL